MIIDYEHPRFLNWINKKHMIEYLSFYPYLQALSSLENKIILTCELIPQLWTLHLVNFVKFLSTLLGVATHCCNISDSSRSATHLSNSPLSFLPWFYSTKMPLLFAQNRAQMLMISRAALVHRWRGPEGLLVDGSDFFFEWFWWQMNVSLSVNTGNIL